MRRANNRKPEVVKIAGLLERGYRISLENLPMSTENVFTDYDENDPARIEFRLSDGNKLEVVFPEVGVCYLICKPKGKVINTPSKFRSAFPVKIGFVPILGPVEHNEFLYKPEAARLALLSHRASRNFRNIWRHFPQHFDEFRALIRSTWPGMDIEPPIVEYGDQKPVLFMFCPEERYPREIYWAGFGFQVWCQMLTYAIRARNDSLLIIDEPDIYLHSDLQRQLFSFLQELGPDILIATHSTEIITEAEPSDLLIISKKAKSAKRLKDPSGLRNLFEGLGSNLNPVLTQLAKARRGLFLEGKDFQILGAFAQKLNRTAIARRSGFAVVSVEGFNPEKISDYSKGIELTLGTKILKAVIFDRDYKSNDEIAEIEHHLSKKAIFAHIHRRKEIENYLLEPAPLIRAIEAKIADQNARTGKNLEFTEDIQEILRKITDPMKHNVAAQNQTKRVEYAKRTIPRLDPATITASVMEEFDELWCDLSKRLEIVPGKKILASLNEYFQIQYGVSITYKQIINRFRIEDIPDEIKNLINKIDQFREESPP
jgi:hypothetical protein